MTRFKHPPGPDSAESPPPAGPLHSVAHCPICGGGLLGIRLCHGDPTGQLAAEAGEDASVDTRSPHGLILCDECEAMWRNPQLSGSHQYPDHEQPVCPRCQISLWEKSHWASSDEIARLDWSQHVDHDLDWQTTDSTTPGDSATP